jgi:ABC-type lipoprotein release transport system permease subunit
MRSPNERGKSGFRVSLGASPAGLLRDFLAQGLRLCLVGTTIGLIGALVLARLLRGLLFGVAASDGVTILVVIATMTAVVAAATYLPAWRASRIDPIVALRQDWGPRARKATAPGRSSTPM